MKTGLIRLLALALLAAPLAAHAGPTQASPSVFTSPVYDRTDGVKLEINTKAPYILENGTSAGPLAAGYRETFAYGADKGFSQLDFGPGTTCIGNATTVPCLMTFGSGVKLAWASVVTETLNPAMVATGLEIGADLVDNDGLEIFGGVLGASGRPFVVGDDPAFYGCWTFSVADVSGTDDLHVGFRRPEPMNAVFDNYLDLVSIGLVGASGDIQIETIDDNNATVTTDTTMNWADTETHTLCAGVGGTGAAAYSVDGSAPTVTASVTIDDGDPMIPFFHYIHATTTPGSIILKNWSVGYCQRDGASGLAERVCDATR